MAGFPYFPTYFGRGSAWTILGASAIGDFDASMSTLLMLAKFQAKDDGEDVNKVPYYAGEIPHEIRIDGTTYYYSIDSTPLFVIALYDYYRWSGEGALLKHLYDDVIRAMNWCTAADRDGGGLIEHGPEGFLPDTRGWALSSEASRRSMFKRSSAAPSYPALRSRRS